MSTKKQLPIPSFGRTLHPAKINLQPASSTIRPTCLSCFEAVSWSSSQPIYKKADQHWTEHLPGDGSPLLEERVWWGRPSARSLAATPLPSWLWFAVYTLLCYQRMARWCTRADFFPLSCPGIIPARCVRQGQRAQPWALHGV